VTVPDSFGFQIVTNRNRTVRADNPPSHYRLSLDQLQALYQ